MPIPTVESKNRMYITLLIGQAAVIIILVCALVHWVQKGIRSKSAHSPLDRSESSGTADEDVSTPCKYLLPSLMPSLRRISLL